MDQVRESYSPCEVFGSDSGQGTLLTIFRPKVADEQLILKRLERIEQAISPNRPRAFEGRCSGSSDPVVAAQIEAEKSELIKQLGVRDDDLVVWVLSFADGRPPMQPTLRRASWSP
jgi:hypothetical protein